jgi:hypothetical protein
MVARVVSLTGRTKGNERRDDRKRMKDDRHGDIARLRHYKASVLPLSNFPTLSLCASPAASNTWSNTSSPTRMHPSPRSVQAITSLDGYKTRDKLCVPLLTFPRDF